MLNVIEERTIYLSQRAKIYSCTSYKINCGCCLFGVSVYRLNFCVVFLAEGKSNVGFNGYKLLLIRNLLSYIASNFYFGCIINRNISSVMSLLYLYLALDTSVCEYHLE